ncbi:hypothetical protein [Agrobacterium pusense]|uniref:hypothetical protein n=1 Tax=Agrobacterium pusense TaxID=648995 RepID=UPI000EE1C52E|nr:hypothetical protein [Agrobacterium sp.]
MVTAFSKFMRDHCKSAAFAALLINLASSLGYLPENFAIPFAIVAAILIAATIIYETLYGMAVEALEDRVGKFSERDYLKAMGEDEVDQLEPGQDKFSD